MDTSEPRLSAQTLKVLVALLASPHDGLSGAQISRETGLSSGTLYPILMRLERADWLDSRWEAGDPRALGRPRRRFYSVTALGARKTRAAYRELETVAGRLAWA